MTDTNVTVYQDRPAGRWRVAVLGGWHPTWQEITLFGYRSRKRAERRAARIRRKMVNQEASRQHRLSQRLAEDARIRSSLEERS